MSQHLSKLYWMLVLLVGSCTSTVVYAQNLASSEHQHLAQVMRQLDMIDYLVAQSADQVNQSTSTSRYHLDYQRLQKDLTRIRQGLNDYIEPKRAQPRDPVEFSGQYRLLNQGAQ
ncbi:integrative conjugative element protein, RAQPRD family [Zophobihabitans entericus]|uniref:Raqprd family integrative conjugative element protein n=1 Tax=Zophobihabitans entericus TaxID=1635327 RepID=A0A6G9ICA2_9GAMM|nr:RAQPRD family integrative conjugative element protein [Zophobihabitans entericus]QIQ21467.1 hypothetical protein IPMB12_07085 [Zophobihabitans entericus]